MSPENTREENVFAADAANAVPKAGPNDRDGRGPEDLSAEIVKEIDRLPGDRVTCRWVAGNNYRCNWWAREGTAGYDNPGMRGLTVTTHRVRQSRFLNVTRGYRGLVITAGGTAEPGEGGARRS